VRQLRPPGPLGPRAWARLHAMDDITDRIESLLTSPWALVVIFAVCALDAFFPAVPGETTVITGAVFAAQGEYPLSAVIAVGAAGAIVGDHVSYTIGRVVGRRAIDRMSHRKRVAALRGRAQAALDKHGGPALIVMRFVPGGRSLSTALAGSLHFPLRRFTPYVLVGGVLWSVQAALLGYFAGQLIHDNYVLATIAGIAASLLLAVGIELIRHRVKGYLRRRRESRVAGSV
jgi:membrane-associated protein